MTAGRSVSAARSEDALPIAHAWRQPSTADVVRATEGRPLRLKAGGRPPPITALRLRSPRTLSATSHYMAADVAAAAEAVCRTRVHADRRRLSPTHLEGPGTRTQQPGQGGTRSCERGALPRRADGAGTRLPSAVVPAAIPDVRKSWDHDLARSECNHRLLSFGLRSRLMSLPKTCNNSVIAARRDQPEERIPLVSVADRRHSQASSIVEATCCRPMSVHANVAQHPEIPASARHMTRIADAERREQPINARLARSLQRRGHYAAPCGMSARKVGT
jgi:hypothetical protein